MDCLKLAGNLEILGYSGISISTETFQSLYNSLLILQKENHFRKCYYWGRIYGIQNDYDIAYGYKKDCMKEQVYYYSTDRITWLLLPKATKCGRFLTPLAINMFQGDPSIVTNVYNVNPPFPPNEDPKIYYDGPIPKELKEEDRLAASVELITEDIAIIPRGGWFLCPNGNVIENPGFEGLCSNDAVLLESYLHARPPKQKWNTNILSRPDYNYALDFLDPIDMDVTRGCWNVTVMDDAVVINNMYWDRMIFYHKLNTPDYGFLYVGPGKRNLDLPFMI